MPIIIRFDTDERMQFKVIRYRRAPDLSRDTRVASRLIRMRGRGRSKDPDAQKIARGRGAYSPKGALGDKRQGCYVNARYTRSVKPWMSAKVKAAVVSNAKMTMKARGKYIVDEGKALGGDQPEAFGTNLNMPNESKDGRHWWITLSPGKKEIDFKSFTESFVNRLEKATGHKFDWMAGAHFNTEHPHVHLMLDGYSKNDGSEIVFAPEMVKKGMRNISREILTTHYGERTQAEMDEAMIEAIEKSGPSRDLDNLVSRRIKDGEIHSGTFSDVDRRTGLIGRLEKLKKMRAVDFENGIYTFDDDWRNKIHAAGRWEDFQSAMGIYRSGGGREKAVLASEGFKGGMSNRPVLKVLDGAGGGPKGAFFKSEEGVAVYVPVNRFNDDFQSLVAGDRWTVNFKVTGVGELVPTFSEPRSMGDEGVSF